MGGNFMLEKVLQKYLGTTCVAPVAQGLSTKGWRGMLDCTNGDCGDDSGQDCGTDTYES